MGKPKGGKLALQKITHGQGEAAVATPTTHARAGKSAPSRTVGVCEKTIAEAATGAATRHQE